MTNVANDTNATACSWQCNEGDLGFECYLTAGDLACTLVGSITFVLMTVPAYCCLLKTNPFHSTKSSKKLPRLSHSRSSIKSKQSSRYSYESPGSGMSPSSPSAGGSPGVAIESKIPPSLKMNKPELSPSKVSNTSHSRNASISVLSVMSKVPTGKSGKSLHLSNRKDKISWYLGVTCATLYLIREAFDVCLWIAWMNTFVYCEGSPAWNADFGLHICNALSNTSLYLYFIYRLYTLYQQSSGMYSMFYKTGVLRKLQLFGFSLWFS